ncbi:HlyD family type I secretion periplasmic adaptor subunit [Pseudorhodobacter wandonensis]|uniref:HlyD family type I secretion periplasmic adaptor subunit n=1 Tax=Pseudorhodobacter wandonensis TaxID=1120568 RepID=UPI00067DFCBD|nr:HlyD family type I secretion periplasmic adaptor subunit [Pseudorhodobacter wandonensis]
METQQKFVPQKPANAVRTTTFRFGPQVITACILGALLIGGIGGWAATSKLAGAVIAPGLVIIDQNVKSVQHRDGGIVSDIAVKSGDHVEAGQILLRLDDAQTRAELAIVQSQSTELTARKARLLAEREQLPDIIFPVGYTTDAESQAFAAAESRLFNGQRESREGQKQQLELGIVQIEEEIAGLQNQRAAKDEEIALVEAEFDRTDDLNKRKLIEASRLYTISRERVNLRGELGEIDSSIARARTRSSEIRLEILSIDQTARTEAQRELSVVEARLQELNERASALRDRLSRTDIRAPLSGTINELNIHTVGGVISPAEVLATIVPLNARLKIEVRLAPVNIEQVAKDSPARLRFSSFNQRTTPELLGNVSYVAPATTQDKVTGERYYIGHVEVSALELAKLGESALMPGMPVEVYVQTDERTVVSYLAKPVMDQFSRAFRER